MAHNSLAEDILSTLRERGETLAVAESLTGGLLASALVDVPGASDVFVGGVVAYSLQAKRDLLGVDQETLEHHGAVSEEVALAMAHGVCEALAKASYGVSTTGVAGPDPDPQSGAPAGVVYIAISGPDDHRVVERFTFEGVRSDIRAATVRQALELLARVLEDSR
jgi:nicotinamide-nucleotide amidase